MKNYFKQAGDLPQDDKPILNDNQSVVDYLDSITTGISYRNNSNYQVLSGGMIITTLDKVKEMVDSGYNIINSELLSEINGEYLISIEFEELDQDKKKSR